MSLCSRAWELQLLKSMCPRAPAPQQEKTLQWEAHAPQLENIPLSNDDPEQPKITKQTNQKTWCSQKNKYLFKKFK